MFLAAKRSDSHATNDVTAPSMSNSIATSVHVQRSRLDEIGLGDPDFTIELIDIMLEDGLERTRTLRAAYQAERMADVDVYKRQA